MDILRLLLAFSGKLYSNVFFLLKIMELNILNTTYTVSWVIKF